MTTHNPQGKDPNQVRSNPNSDQGNLSDMRDQQKRDAARKSDEAGNASQSQNRSEPGNSRNASGRNEDDSSSTR